MTELADLKTDLLAAAGRRPLWLDFAQQTVAAKLQVVDEAMAMVKFYESLAELIWQRRWCVGGDRNQILVLTLVPLRDTLRLVQGHCGLFIIYRFCN